ncbi:MAG: N-acetylmuramoyl-L-alanine amidase [Bacteroidota bacterium]
MKSFAALSLACLLSCVGLYAQKGGNIYIRNLEDQAALKQNMVKSNRLLQAQDDSKTALFLSEPLSVPTIRGAQAAFTAVSLSWSAPHWDRQRSKVWLRMYNNSDEEEYMQIKVDEHRESSVEKFAGQLQFFQKIYRYCQLRVVLEAGANSSMENIVIRFYDPGPTSYKAKQAAAVARGSCDCPLPEFLERDEWCSGGRCPTSTSPQQTEVTHLIVHHSAGSNASNDWPAVVRSIWDFHVNTREWADIGYNWLIDSDGKIYQGRGDDIRGAHFCGANSNTMGVCLLGTFTTEMPSQESQDALSKLLSWKACDRDIDPLQTQLHPGTGKTIYTITGHRDGCATECPGTAFFPTLASLRTKVDQQLKACATTSVETMAAAQEKIHLFPNPLFGDQLSIDLSAQAFRSQPVYIELINSANGRRLKEWMKSGQDRMATLAIGELPAGLYLLYIRSGEKAFIRKIVKY